MPVFAAGADRQSREVTKQRVQVARVSAGLTKCACMHACMHADVQVAMNAVKM